MINADWSFASISTLAVRLPARMFERFAGSIPAWAANFRRPIFWMACLAFERVSAVSFFSFSRALIADWSLAIAWGVAETLEQIRREISLKE